MAQHKEGKGSGKFVLGAALGAAVGAITALLTAPKSGKETREDLKNKATEMSHEAMRQLRKLEGELNKRISDAKRLVGKLEGNARTEVESLITRAERMRDRAMKMAEDIKNDTKKQLDEKFMSDAKAVLDDLQDIKQHVSDRAKKEAKK
ncbi:MAG TPA: YtxH domain-containing protein [Candidatus Saccharimonadales bacterium]|nr:YtxH domain-containing protein [Candidatus Saccharimonadales bacterium]